MGDVIKYPWEQLPAVQVGNALQQTMNTVEMLQRDFAIAVQMTAILVHSNRPELAMLVNTPRGQIIPRGECKFKDGSRVEFQDIGMCQPNAPQMLVPELLARVYNIARELGLEIEP